MEHYRESPSKRKKQRNKAGIFFLHLWGNFLQAPAGDSRTL